MVERVLLAESDELFGALFEAALRQAGYAVTRVGGGAEALAELSPEAPPVGLLVTDIALGEGPNGWQVAWRARARSPEAPVVYLTDAQADEWRPQHVPYGRLLLKPFPVHELVDMADALTAPRPEGGGMRPSA